MQTQVAQLMKERRKNLRDSYSGVDQVIQMRVIQIAILLALQMREVEAQEGVEETIEGAIMISGLIFPSLKEC